MTYKHGEATSKDNALPIDAEDQGVVSVLNSSSRPLGAGETFTGEWEDAIEFQTILVSGGSDVPGTLYVDVSTNKEGDSEDTTVIQLSHGRDGDWKPHTLVRISRYFRVRVVNGASQQTVLQVQTILGQSSAIAMPTSRASQLVGDFSDVLNMRMITDPRLDEAANRQVDRSTIHKFGRNPSVTASSREIVAHSAENFQGFLTAASAVRVRAGGDAADDASGLGAQKILILGLDENWASASEVVTTNGASASSATTTTFIRVFRIYVTDCGTYNGANEGDVAIETTGGLLCAEIQAGFGQSEIAMFTVPLGKEAYIRRVNAVVEGLKPADILFLQRQNADDVTTPFTSSRVYFVMSQLEGTSHHAFDAYEGPFPAKTDLYVEAIAASGAAPGVSAAMDIVMIDIA